MILPVTSSSLHAVWNGLDEIGLTVGLSRLVGETNALYRARLEDVFARPGNSTYQGLVYSLAREFGIAIQPAMTLTPLSGDPPRAILENQCLTLYSDLDSIVATWFLRDPDISTLALLAQAINDTGAYTATLDDDIDPDSYSAGLINADSSVWILGETVPASTSFPLGHTLINPDTMVFEEYEVFKNFVNPPASPGDFYVNLATGQVNCIILPNGTSRVTYQYRTNSLGLNYLPIVISDLNSLDTRAWFFSQVEQNVWASPEQRYNPGVPYTLMRRIIDEINLNCPVLWGD